jgi:vacuolar-type H+-ATPase subunit I/STV1
MVILEVVNSVARLLLHEYNHTILDSTTLSPLQDIAAELKKLEGRLDKVRTNLPADSNLIAEVDQLTKTLNTKAEQLRSLGDELGSLKSLLSERLKRPRHLDDRVSLLKVTEKAISELVQQKPSLQDVIVFTHPVDITVLLNADIMLTVIQNLIRNAIEELDDNVAPNKKIVISLGLDKIGEANNSSEAGSLAVATILNDKSRVAKIASSIRMGLEGYPSTKPFGCGVGMDITKLVFRELMGASIHVIEDDCSAGIKIVFKTNSLNTALVPAGQ